MNKALCIFNTYKEEPDCQEDESEYYPKLCGPERDLRRLHFLFSGHGVYNQKLVVETDDKVDSTIKCPTPIGECIVGDNGKLCSIQHI